MKDSLFWKCIAILLVAGLFYVGAGLTTRSDAPPSQPSLFSNSAQAAPFVARNSLRWKELGVVQSLAGNNKAFRTKVPGGWLIEIVNERYISKSGHNESSVSVVFFPDPNHTWDGGSLP